MGSLASQYPVQLLEGANPKTGATISGATTYYSKRLDCLGASRASFHLIWTSTVSGTPVVQSSNVDEAAADSDTGWVTESDVNFPTVPAGSASSTMVHVFENCARWLRIKYPNDSGSGTLRVIGTAKE